MPADRMKATNRIDAATRSGGLQPTLNSAAFGTHAEDEEMTGAAHWRLPRSEAPQTNTDASRLSQTSTASRRFVLLLTWIYCLSWAADFRGEEGGSVFQMLTFAVTAGTGFLMAIAGWSVLFRRPLGWMILLWTIFLASTVVVALVQNVAMGNYARTIIPWLLVLTSMIVCQVAAGFGITL